MACVLVSLTGADLLLKLGMCLKKKKGSLKKKKIGSRMRGDMCLVVRSAHLPLGGP